MKIIINDKKSESEFIQYLNSRNTENNEQVESAVATIISDVIKNRDDAVRKYTLSFDGVMPEKLELSKEQIDVAAAKCDKALIEVMKKAAENIKAYHQNQKRVGFEMNLEGNSKLGQILRPLKRVGIYVPGGTAAYPSSVLMNTIPAKVAGVYEVIMVTPPQKDGLLNPDVIAAAKIAGVDRIFTIGGAQAIAALAYGTAEVPMVDKIVGPGNIYVATAKKQVFGKVNIDMIAGPSEILIIADDTANAKFIAADMLSQAEHDKLASAVLLTTSDTLSKKVEIEIKKQLAELKRKEIAECSINDFCAIIVSENIDRCVEIANIVAPEHLEVMVNDPFSILPQIENAGSIFLGEYSPEPLGDYFAGPNHVLPTSGTARFSSPLSVDDFYKKMSYISYSKELLEKSHKEIEMFAIHEGLTAHANSVKIRFDD
ncbi:MAG: histidinol dehydrogenase [Clostridia bacterium]